MRKWAAIVGQIPSAHSGDRPVRDSMQCPDCLYSYHNVCVGIRPRGDCGCSSIAEIAERYVCASNFIEISSLTFIEFGGPRKTSYGWGTFLKQFFFGIQIKYGCNPSWCDMFFAECFCSRCEKSGKNHPLLATI